MKQIQLQIILMSFFFTSIASTLESKLPSCPNIFDKNSNIFKLFYSQTRSLWRDWSSTGLFLFYNLQKF